MSGSRKPRAQKRTGPELWTLAEVARHTGETAHTVRNLVASLEVKGKSGNRNLYDPADVLALFKKRNEETEETPDGSREYWEKEKLKRQCEKLEVEVETMRGRLISRDEVLDGYLAMAMKVRQAMLESCEKLPPVLAGLDPKEIKKRMLGHFDDTLAGLRSNKYAEKFEEILKCQAPQKPPRKRPKSPSGKGTKRPSRSGERKKSASVKVPTGTSSSRKKPRG